MDIEKIPCAPFSFRIKPPKLDRPKRVFSRNLDLLTIEVTQTRIPEIRLRFLFRIPLDSFTQAVERTIGRRVADKAGGLLDTRVRVLNIARTERPILSILGIGSSPLLQQTPKKIKELVEARLPSERDVVDLAGRCCFVCSGREKVCLNDVLDVAEVAASFSIAIDLDDAVVEHCLDPAWNHSSVGSIRVLPLAKHVEVTQTNTAHSIMLVEDLCIEFVDVFRNRIGRERLADHVLDLREGRMIAVG